MPDLIGHIKAQLAMPGTASSDYDLNPDIILPKERKLRDAAVLVPLVDMGGTTHILLTKRSSVLKHHPGQISFPGGKLEDSDSTVTDAALREAEEEIGLPRDAVDVFGMLSPHETVTGFTVTPVVGRVIRPFDIVAEKGEVEDVFTVPLDFLLDNDRFAIEARRWRGKWRHYYTIPYGPYYIWGATARMLKALAEVAAR